MFNQANRYLDLLLDEMDYLCLKPNSGTDSGHLRNGYFRSQVKSHYIFYTISVKKEVVEIVRVLQQVMDVERQLES